MVSKVYLHPLKCTHRLYQFSLLRLGLKGKVDATLQIKVLIQLIVYAYYVFYLYTDEEGRWRDIVASCSAGDKDWEDVQEAGFSRTQSSGTVLCVYSTTCISCLCFGLF